MSRLKKSFKVENNVSELINMEIGKRMAETGKKVNRKDIISEIAEFSEVGTDNISMVLRGKVTPSLPVALKIAQFFDKKVEDIFKIS